MHDNGEIFCVKGRTRMICLCCDIFLSSQFVAMRIDYMIVQSILRRILIKWDLSTRLQAHSWLILIYTRSHIPSTPRRWQDRYFSTKRWKSPQKAPFSFSFFPHVFTFLYSNMYIILIPQIVLVDIKSMSIYDRALSPRCAYSRQGELFDR